MKANRLDQDCFKMQQVEQENVIGELICKKITSPYYISSEHTVDAIAGLFSRDVSLNALGVVDKDGRAEGIIMRNDIFALIGQKFGRELYMNKSIRDVIKEVNLIYYKRNTFSVIDEISEDLKSPENRYYILVDAENIYKGIVSSFDLVLFLSEMMTRELKAARRVHSAIVRDELNINTDKLSIYGSTEMAGETGGDFQYIRRIDENRLFISLCDVSGKGLNAGLISVAVSSMYAAYDFSNGMYLLIQKINSYINDLFNGEIFLTGIFIDLNESTGEAEIYDMGHSMIYMLKSNKVHSFENHSENFPLGIQKDLKPSVSRIKMESGNFIISYSDGFPEQNNNANERFGEPRLIFLARKYQNSSLKQIKDILYEEVKTWRFGHAQSDDMSLLMIRYK